MRSDSHPDPPTDSPFPGPTPPLSDRQSAARYAALHRAAHARRSPPRPVLVHQDAPTLDTVENNKTKFSKRQVKQAEEARRLTHNLALPSIRALKDALHIAIRESVLGIVDWR